MTRMRLPRVHLTLDVLEHLAGMPNPCAHLTIFRPVLKNVLITYQLGIN